MLAVDYQPSELELAMLDRHMVGVVEFGPLTPEEDERVRSWEAYCEEEEAERLLFEASGGRSVCPKCQHRSVKTRTVCTLGYPGHPGAEFSELAKCERDECDYCEL